MSARSTSLRLGRAKLRYAGLLIILAALIAAGYLGFRAFVTASDLGVLNLYVLAVVAGVASFFSPCAFPLLPSYLSFYYLARQKKEATPSGGFGGALGAVGVFALTMGTAMLVVSGLVAASHQTLIGQLKAVAPKIKLASSIVLVLVGSFNLYSAFNVEQFVRLLFP